MKSSRLRASARTRLSGTAVGFARDQQGGATIWNVTWLLVFAGMAGLSIDSSNGYRNLAISQSTSDAASLAGVIELPHPQLEVPYDPTDADDRDALAIAAAKAKAVEFAEKNMVPGTYGDVLTEDEVFVGNWAPATRTFTPIGTGFGNKTMNAVRVYLQQDEDLRGNGVNTSLMHMVGMDNWTVSTTATAQIGWDACIDHAMMTKEKFCANNHTQWGADMCLYADAGFKLGPNNEWMGNEVRSPADADNSGINDKNFDDPDFHLNASGNGLKVPHVDEIPYIANRILSQYATQYTQPKLMAKHADGVIRLGANSISGTDGQTWLDFEPTVQFAGLGELSSVGALLGLSAKGGVKGPPSDDDDPGTEDPGTEDPSNTGDGDTMKTCQGGKSPGSAIDPITDFDRQVLGYGDDDPDNDVKFDTAYPDNKKYNSGTLLPDRVYFHEGGKLSITGDLSDVTIVTKGEIAISNGVTLSNVTLVGLEDTPNGAKGLTVQGQSAKFGTTDATCNEEGAVKVYTMGSFTTPAKTEFNGAMVVAGGTIGFAAQASAPNGVAMYAGGHIFFTSNPGGGGSKREINSCGVPITIGDEDLRLSLVE